jgi:NADPH-dependent curcumin reductase CurA
MTGTTIDRVFDGLPAAPEAFAYPLTGRSVGQVVIRLA